MKYFIIKDEDGPIIIGRKEVNIKTYEQDLLAINKTWSGFTKLYGTEYRPKVYLKKYSKWMLMSPYEFGDINTTERVYRSILIETNDALKRIFSLTAKYIPINVLER